MLWTDYLVGSQFTCIEVVQVVRSPAGDIQNSLTRNSFHCLFVFLVASVYVIRIPHAMLLPRALTSSFDQCAHTEPLALLPVCGTGAFDACV